ncbi:NAD(+) synthetase [Candidatus Woesearchaeota archaeon]|jgi:NAD+ synthase|nr:NAD(+) synthetase [Candidatus Woesearchaeota archaeon]|tara:strand:- start:319 stop:1077 length:759 start_codon:yes stop_codon:yes gene_type:complete
MDNGTVYKKLIIGIKGYFDRNNIKKAVIGLSGGIDSSLSAKLVADAIGKENVHGLIMPLKGLSSEENIKDAVEFCTLNSINYSLIFINDFIKEFEKLDWKQSKIAEMNIASRIRAVVLYNYANTHNALVIGTSNKTEILLGYFTKYGDGAVDIEVIGELFKTEVKKVAGFLKISEKIINKVPTAELYHGQTDEEELGISYEELDKILKLYEEDNSMLNIIEKGFEKEKVDNIFQRIEANKHKRDMPTVVRVF